MLLEISNILRSGKEPPAPIEQDAVWDLRVSWEISLAPARNQTLNPWSQAHTQT